MDLYEAIGLLGLEPIVGSDDNDYSSKDVEKCFRQQALRHHPDKGGDASYFQLLQRAKDLLLDHIAGNSFRMSNASSGPGDTNTTAVSTSLYQHRTCVRQVLTTKGTMYGETKSLVAATDDGLIVIELKKESNNYFSGGLERVVSFTTHRNDCSFLCCASARSSSDDSADILYAGSKDGFVHKIEVATRRLTSWQILSRERVVAISVVRDWVAIAAADGGIYIYEDQNGTSIPTMVWGAPTGAYKGIAHRKNASINMTPETIFLEEGSSSDSLYLWVGGTSGDCVTGRLLMWELDIEKDLYSLYDDEMEDFGGEYYIYDSDTGSSGEESEDGGNGEEENDISIDMIVEEGSIFSLSKHKRTIAVASGKCIIIWNYNENVTDLKHSGKKPTKMKSIQTNDQTIYTLCLNERFLAAAGSGESIMVWDRDTWTMLHYLPLQRPPSGCCLATNCILTLDWFLDDSQILISGGYDGTVTMWTLANRLE